MNDTPQSPDSPTTPAELQDSARAAGMASRQIVVLVAGLFTTALTLYGVYWIRTNTKDDVMGWYANYVIPMGALLVGGAAGSGYGLASWLTGVKIRSRMLVTVSVLQILAYFAAQYVEFLSYGPLVDQSGHQVTFFEYFHIMAVSFAWKEKNGTIGAAMGMWGYCFRGLELIGFVGGGLIVPGILYGSPYCERCHIYMKTKVLGTVGGSVPAKKIKKADTEGQAAHQKEQQEAYNRGLEFSMAMVKAASENNEPVLNEIVDEKRKEKKATAKLPIYFEVALVNCQCCDSGYLNQSTLAIQGNNHVRSDVRRTDLSAESVKLARQACGRK